MTPISPRVATILFVAGFLLIESLGKRLFDNDKWGENAKLISLGTKAITDQATLAGMSSSKKT